jgi:membrane-bound serine protease (ClpP class)
VDPWFVDIGFYLAGLILIFLELFIPSGGVLGIAAIICIVYSLQSLFARGQPAAAWSAIGLTLVYVVFVVRFWLKRIRHSASLTGSLATGRDVERARSLIGRTGVTITPLRPAGVARIDGERLDVVAGGAFLDANEEVSVVEVSGNRIVVRRLAGGATRTEGMTP